MWHNHNTRLRGIGKGGEEATKTKILRQKSVSTKAGEGNTQQSRDQHMNEKQGEQESDMKQWYNRDDKKTKQQPGQSN